MKTFERILQCRTPEELASIYHEINKWAIYANGRLLDKNDPSDFIEWLSKESDDIDDKTIFNNTSTYDVKKRQVVTLIGSGKFIDQFKNTAKELTMQGIIVFTPAIFDDPNFFKDPSLITEEEHQMYDEIHRAKMLMSDYVLVINPNGYIGHDTNEEIEFCKRNNIRVLKLVVGYRKCNKE